MTLHNTFIRKAVRRAGALTAGAMLIAASMGTAPVLASEVDGQVVGSIPLPTFGGDENNSAEEPHFPLGTDVLASSAGGQEQTVDIPTGSDVDTTGNPTDNNQEKTDKPENTDEPENTDNRVVVKNTEQGFSFLLPDTAFARTSDYGSTLVDLYPDNHIPFVLVAYYDWTTDGAGYLETIAKNASENNTIVNEPRGPESVEGNPGMYALTYSFLSSGNEMQVTCFTEEFDEGFMYFETRYYNDSDQVLISEVLATILSTAQPDPEFYG